jgi:hypothetical protein
MYPDLPYPGYSWSMNHHMGVMEEESLYQMLLAGAMFSRSDDPATDINSYLVANNILTTNVRQDTRQVETWRDYQQMLSELSLIFSTEVQRHITPTPLGLAFLDRSLTFQEVVTLQAFRYQYPNGHRVQISTTLRSQLRGSIYSQASTLLELQSHAGVQIRPAVLIWRVLRELQARGENPAITRAEIQAYLLPCATHDDAAPAIQALIAARNGGVALPEQRHATRDVQEWMSWLLATPVFDGSRSQQAHLRISEYGERHAAEIDEICYSLEESATFWTPESSGVEDRVAWYSEYGTVDLSVNLIPSELIRHVSDAEDAEEDEDFADEGVSPGAITLRDFDPASYSSAEQSIGGGTGATIHSSYDAGLSDRQHRLHDLMVLLIGNTCRVNGGRVFDDPSSVDLLVGYESMEFIVEVKSVTPRNFVKRLRYALGQLYHYDYLRSAQTTAPRRKVVAVAAQLSEASWCVPFLNNFLDTDLLSIQSDLLKVHSPFPISQRLFTPVHPAPMLPLL